MFAAAWFCAGVALGGALALLVVALLTAARRAEPDRAEPVPAGEIIPFRRRV